MQTWDNPEKLSLYPAIDDHVALYTIEAGVSISNVTIIKNNIYKTPKKNIVHRDLRNISCNCHIQEGFNPDTSSGVCGSECINRILFIECYGDTRCGKNCGNRQIQSPERHTFLLFKCGQKGLGLKTQSFIKKGEYVLEFVGEIIDRTQFDERNRMYAENGHKHSYIMELRSKYFIDATQMGGIARYINHSCDPNLVSQKWSIHGYTRIGFFAVRDIQSGTELTFDYKFERFGEPQRCLCGSSNCTGFMGKSKKINTKANQNENSSILTEKASQPRINLKNITNSKNILKPDKNPVTFIKYMFKLLDWNKRIKVVKYLKDSCPETFLIKLVNNKLPKLLVLWMSQLESHKYDISYHRKIIELLKFLPITNRDQVPFHSLLDALNGWMRKAACRHIKGEENEIVEFGRLCRVFMDRIAELPQDAQEIMTNTDVVLGNNLTDTSLSNHSTENATYNKEHKKSSTPGKLWFKPVFFFSNFYESFITGVLSLRNPVSQY